MNQELEGQSPTSSSTLILIWKIKPAALPKQECHSKGENISIYSLLLEFLSHSIGHKSVCYLVFHFWEEQCVCLSALCVEHSLCVLVYVVLSHYVCVCVAGRLTVCVCVCLSNLIVCVCVASRT